MNCAHLISRKRRIKHTHTHTNSPYAQTQTNNYCLYKTHLLSQTTTTFHLVSFLLASRGFVHAAIAAAAAGKSCTDENDDDHDDDG